MIKVVNPLIRKTENSDSAYNCSCVCNVQEDNKSSADSWTWLPWNSCGCSCKTGNTTNSNYNRDLSKDK